MLTLEQINREGIVVIDGHTRERESSFLNPFPSSLHQSLVCYLPRYFNNIHSSINSVLIPKLHKLVKQRPPIAVHSIGLGPI